MLRIVPMIIPDVLRYIFHNLYIYIFIMIIYDLYFIIY